MYQGNNPTALTSQKLLADALDELLREKSFKEVSVKELCSRSGVSRQTFYSLFGTKENIMLYKLEEAKAAKPWHEASEAMPLNEMCQEYARYVSENYAMLSMLIENGLSEIIYTMFYGSLSSCQQSFVDIGDSDRRYAACFVSAGLSQLTQKYIREHKKSNPAELARLAYKIMSGSIYHL